jgi:arylsulfatase A-like enzyme
MPPAERPRTAVGLGILGLLAAFSMQGASGHREGQEFQPIMHLVRDVASPELGKQRVDRALEMDPAEIFRGVRTRRFLYAATHQGPWLLYDLERDPFELENRVEDPAYRKEIETLHALTASWLRAWRDAYRLGAIER